MKGTKNIGKELTRVFTDKNWLLTCLFFPVFLLWLCIVLWEV